MKWVLGYGYFFFFVLFSFASEARDRWKRQYFDTKKATTLLEDTLKSVRLELHTFYSKMLQQIQARDGAKRRTQAKKHASTKLKVV